MTDGLNFHPPGIRSPSGWSKPRTPCSPLNAEKNGPTKVGIIPSRGAARRAQNEKKTTPWTTTLRPSVVCVCRRCTGPARHTTRRRKGRSSTKQQQKTKPTRGEQKQNPSFSHLYGPSQENRNRAKPSVRQHTTDRCTADVSPKEKKTPSNTLPFAHTLNYSSMTLSLTSPPT